MPGNQHEQGKKSSVDTAGHLLCIVCLLCRFGGLSGHRISLDSTASSCFLSRTCHLLADVGGGHSPSWQKKRLRAGEPWIQIQDLPCTPWPVSPVTEGSHVTQASVSPFKKENWSSCSPSLLGPSSVRVERGEVPKVPCQLSGTYSWEGPLLLLVTMGLRHRLYVEPLAKKRQDLFCLH